MTDNAHYEHAQPLPACEEFHKDHERRLRHHEAWMSGADVKFSTNERYMMRVEGEIKSMRMDVVESKVSIARFAATAALFGSVMGTVIAAGIMAFFTHSSGG